MIAPAPANATTLVIKPVILGEDSSKVGTVNIKPIIPPTARAKAIILGNKSKSINIQSFSHIVISANLSRFLTRTKIWEMSH